MKDLFGPFEVRGTVPRSAAMEIMTEASAAMIAHLREHQDALIGAALLLTVDAQRRAKQVRWHSPDVVSGIQEGEPFPSNDFRMWAEQDPPTVWCDLPSPEPKEPAMTHDIGRSLAGVAGTAHEILYRARPPVPHPTSVALWFLTCPGQSPAWECYLLSVVHLRPTPPGLPDPVIVREGATHELVLAALDPGRHPDATDESTWSMLSPYNAVVQFTVPTDVDADKTAFALVNCVLAGELPAEPALSGATEPWTSAVLADARARCAAAAAWDAVDDLDDEPRGWPVPIPSNPAGLDDLDNDWPGPDERYGAPHNVLGHPLLVLCPKLGEWIHNRTRPIVRRWFR